MVDIKMNKLWDALTYCLFFAGKVGQPRGLRTGIITTRKKVVIADVQE